MQIRVAPAAKRRKAMNSCSKLMRPWLQDVSSSLFSLGRVLCSGPGSVEANDDIA